MPTEPLLDALAKTEWADSQIAVLNEHIGPFLAATPHETVSQLSADGNERTWKFKLVEKLPRKLSVIAASILHNLRTPLDQMVAAVMEKIGKSQSGVSFVFGRSADEFRLQLAKQSKFPDELCALMRDARPYPGGNDVLWALHDLNKRDKHRLGLVPLMLPGETRMSYLRFDFGVPIVVGSRTGKHLFSDRIPPRAELLLTRPPTCLFETPPGTFLSFGDAGSPGDQSLEFMTTTPEAVFKTDIKPVFDVGLDHAGVRGKPIATALKEMRLAVDQVLLDFEKRFF